MDLTRADLRRQSFHGQDLRGESLVGADLRGADFTRADLRGADLSGVRAGMHWRWALIVALAALGLAVGIGAVMGVLGAQLQGLLASADPVRRIVGILTLAQITVFLLAGIGWSLRVAVRQVLPVVAALAVAAGLAAWVTGAGTGAAALAVLALLGATLVITVLASLARVVAGTVGDALFVVVAVSGALSGTLLGGGLASGLVAVGTMLIARRSLHTEAAYPTLIRLATAFACMGGTRFLGADLRGARFDGARLTCADLRGAALQGEELQGAVIGHVLLDDEPVPEPRLA